MKQFTGFTPQQQFTLLQRMGYTGPGDETEMNNFLAATPSAAASLGKYAQVAQQRLMGGKPLSPTVSMAFGGIVQNTVTEANQQSFTTQQDPQKAYEDSQKQVNWITNRIISLNEELNKTSTNSVAATQLQNQIDLNATQLSEAQQSMSLAQTLLSQGSAAAER